MRCSAVLFDCDGVLVDSETVSLRALDRYLARYGKVAPPNFAYQLVGKRAVDNGKLIIETFDLPVTLEQHIKEFRQLIEIMVEAEAEAMPHTDHVLRTLHERGIPLAVATSSPRPYLSMILRKFGWEQLFQASVTGEEVQHGKPAPDIFLRAAELLNVPIEECWVIEDAPHGVAAGVASGARVFAVPNSVTRHLAFPAQIEQWTSLAELLAVLA